MAYCKHTDHTDPIVLVAGDQPCSLPSGHAAHAAGDCGTLEKSGEDYHALLATHGDGLFAHLETTFGSEMT
jgi:hypothetical protein